MPVLAFVRHLTCKNHLLPQKEMNYWDVYLDGDWEEINRPLQNGYRLGTTRPAIFSARVGGTGGRPTPLCIHYSLFTDGVRVKREGTKRERENGT